MFTKTLKTYCCFMESEGSGYCQNPPVFGLMDEDERNPEAPSYDSCVEHLGKMIERPSIVRPLLEE